MYIINIIKMHIYNYIYNKYTLNKPAQLSSYHNPFKIRQKEGKLSQFTSYLEI